MTQEEKQLLLIDLCARLPYGVIVHSLGIPHEQKLVSYIPDVEKYNIKPYLRSMSSMTDEERLYFHRNSARVQILIDEEKIITKPFYGYTIHLFDWLNKNMFDYRGLIEKGLALEAPEGMYKIE